MNTEEIKAYIEERIKRAFDHNHNGHNSARINARDIEQDIIHTVAPTTENQATDGTIWEYSDGSIYYKYRKIKGVWIKQS